MDRILYNVKKRIFKGMKGDPAWPYPTYEYEHVSSFYSLVSIRVGEKFKGNIIAEVDHSEISTTLVIIDNS